MKGESDMSECFQCSDIARAPDDSTKSEVPTRTNIRASKPTLSSLARRKDPRVRSLTAIPSTSASPTMESLAPTPSHKSFLPHWSYKKSSIAAATVITVIAAVGLVVLIVLLIRRLRQSWKRYRKRKREYVKSKYYAISPLDDNIGAYTFATPESRMSRETLMFGRSRSNSMTYVVEEAIDKGAVTRVICASKNALLASPLDFISASGRSEVDQEDVSGPDILKEPGRAGFVPRRVVIISPSLSPVESITACEVGRKSWSRPNEQVALRELQKIPPSPVKQQKEVRPASSSKTPDTDMNNLFRLPSIERSTSPLFSF
ncbi:uncharacterized protein ACLA_025630 [Aspergillus clavatus NRRL 1]|uniref:Uncharacterized protein n=1 Tax=Aspergillus clavatus (strain ATCC 1007 / CBS 513.65 / DSM 816 / NCTC 3887 / NRRL 1 / QM 1276 / 107) TaxID=344612 RepID=A1CQC5_ASPCL|nr:uncharacterized protein ACLA_025630 [Aspergillus clavatus NRRL 1]EAW07846.1 conserved hypothetical protein [Aspergillus clavatus NRRL 1]